MSRKTASFLILSIIAALVVWLLEMQSKDQIKEIAQQADTVYMVQYDTVYVFPAMHITGDVK